ncbi:pilus assembly FimT family protein [Oceanisphaera sp. W20_SRM_FM3]|uniref:pilus assembly FimT family protein n=1 Tax=Oceanisphaera sp. W20_SRM_FM3 TaxID=3240267 RepID=UPI003F9740DA
MRKSAGFTLIELVIVIVILGILGAVAAPKLFNLQGDAYGANLNAMKSSISTSMTMANAKAQIQGKFGDLKGTTGDDVVTGYENIEFIGGYPKAINPKGILDTLDGFEVARYKVTLDKTITSAEAAKYEITAGRTALRISPATIVKDDCEVTYVQARAQKDGTGVDNTGAETYAPALVFADTVGC